MIGVRHTACVTATPEEDTKWWQWTSYQIRKTVGCACSGNAGKVFPLRRLQRKLLVSDPGMHHGTCAMHVPWCMLGSLTCDGGENDPGIPGACAPAILRIWQKTHGETSDTIDIIERRKSYVWHIPQDRQVLLAKGMSRWDPVRPFSIPNEIC